MYLPPDAVVWLTGGTDGCDDIARPGIIRPETNKLGTDSMNAKQFSTLLATVLFATAAYSGEKDHHKMEIRVIADNGDGETHLTLDSDDLGFNLHDMEVGENRSIVDKEGRSILVTRGEESFSFDIDGKTIEMPAFDGHNRGNVWISKGDMAPHADIDVRVMHDGMAPNVMFDEEGVMIFSGKEIDEATRQIIRTALESTGHANVHFAGGDEGAPHGVHVVKKVVEVEVTE
jgi:hypothetical protein